jgi:hypothetical protein
MSFPTTPVLTTLTGTDEDPLSEGGNWVGEIRPISAPNIGDCRRLSNVAQKSAGVTVAGTAAWVTDFAEDQESFATITTLPASGESVSVWARVHNPGGVGTAEGYVCVYDPALGVRVYRYTVGATWTGLGATVVVTLATNDKLGISCIGDQIKGYYFTSGVWNEHADLTVTDTVITGTGKIGIQCSFDGDLDDFGGGAVAGVADPTWTSLPRRGFARVA